MSVTDRSADTGKQRARRVSPTLADVVRQDLTALATLVRNLLVENRNFTSGHYFREHPRTEDFVKKVLLEQADAIVGRIETVREDAAAVVADLSEELDRVDLAARQHLARADAARAGRGQLLADLCAQAQQAGSPEALRAVIERALEAGAACPAQPPQPQATAGQEGAPAARAGFGRQRQ